jgi:hypothetical protein
MLTQKTPGKTLTPGRKPKPADAEVLERVSRGRDRLAQITPECTEAYESWRGQQYWHLTSEGRLAHRVQGPVGSRAFDKPSWKVREPHNILLDFVAHETARATARTPGYEVVPVTSDPEDASAAKLAQDVAQYGHDKWDIENVTTQAVIHAIVTGEGFAWPYWDPNVGPFITDEGVGLGEVCAEVYGKGQVAWEPGQRFEKSQWHMVEVAMTPDAVKKLPGYKGPSDPPADADVMAYAQRGYNKAERKMTMVTYYLERPCAEHPDGRWLTLVAGHEVCPERPYPGDGQRPCLVKLSWQIDPDNDRDMGLVPQLLPALRQYLDASNKIDEWKNLHMMGGRIFMTPGLLGKQKITDEPGAVYYVPQPNENIKVWDAPPIPQELFQIRNDALAEMARIAAQNDIPSQVESGKGMVAFVERDEGRKLTFLKQVAKFYAHMMRACLAVVQEYYDEERVIHINGDFGWESVDDFRGAKLSDNIDVRVNASSIEPLTRAQVEQRVVAYADRMWISPEMAMRAIDLGTAEDLLGDILRAEARVHRVIRRIKDGTVFEMQSRLVPAPPDPMTGQRIDPMTGLPHMEVPGWMPMPWDNLRMWRSIFEQFFSTEYAETMPPEVQEASNLIYRQVLDLEQQEAMMQQMRQAQTAAMLGEANAAAPQGGKPMPDMPKMGQEPGGKANGQPQQKIATPNQPANQAGF